MPAVRYNIKFISFLLSILFLPLLFASSALSQEVNSRKEGERSKLIILDSEKKEVESYKLPRFMMGPTAGFNMSSVIFNPTVTQGLQPGFDAGAIFRIDVESYAGIWLEVDFSRRGWKERNDDQPELTYSRSTNYISIPFMTHFMIGKGNVKVTIDAGPQFGLFLSESSVSTYPTSSTGTDGNDDETTTTTTNVRLSQHDIPTQKKFAWGLGGGPGIEYHFKHMVMGLRLNYYYGLGDIFNNTKTDTFNKSSEQVYSAKAYVLYAF